MLGRRIFFFIFNLYNININYTNAYSKILLKFEDPEVLSNYYGNLMDNIDYRHSRTYNDIELITKALEIIKQQEDGITAMEINKCLYAGNTKKKLSCVKRLIYKDKSGENNDNPYYYTKFYNKGTMPNDYKHKFKKNFKDLTKSGNDAKRSFHTLLDFSQDYLDVNDLLRTNSKMVDGIKSPTVTNNRLKGEKKSISHDYIDINDLLKMNNEIPKDIKKTKETNNILSIQNKPFSHEKLRTNNKMDDVKANEKKDDKMKRNLYVFKLMPIKNDMKVFRRFRILPKTNVRKQILRTVSDEDDSSISSAESSKSKEEKVKIKHNALERKAKRYKVLDKSEKEDKSSDGDDSSEDNENDIPMQRPIDIPKKGKRVMLYMQGPGRILKVRNEPRRRLSHFLPKRYHWDDEDMKELRDYWFNGPQGKYAGPRNRRVYKLL